MRNAKRNILCAPNALRVFTLLHLLVGEHGSVVG
jgi:hypothetical protein